MHSWIDISSQSPFPFLKNLKSDSGIKLIDHKKKNEKNYNSSYSSSDNNDTNSYNSLDTNEVFTKYLDDNTSIDLS